MYYTDNEAALIGGLISTYFFQEAVDTSVRMSYHHVLDHLQENRLTIADLARIQSALSFIAPMCSDDREAHKDFMGVRLKTDALLKAANR